MITIPVGRKEKERAVWGGGSRSVLCFLLRGKGRGTSRSMYEVQSVKERVRMLLIFLPDQAAARPSSRLPLAAERSQGPSAYCCGVCLSLDGGSWRMYDVYSAVCTQSVSAVPCTYAQHVRNLIVKIYSYTDIVQRQHPTVWVLYLACHPACTAVVCLPCHMSVPLLVTPR